METTIKTQKQSNLQMFMLGKYFFYKHELYHFDPRLNILCQNTRYVANIDKLGSLDFTVSTVFFGELIKAKVKYEELRFAPE